MQTRLTYLSFMVNKKMCVSFFVQYICLVTIRLQTYHCWHYNYCHVGGYRYCLSLAAGEGYIP